MNGSLDHIRELNVKCLHFMLKYSWGKMMDILQVCEYSFTILFFFMFAESQNFKSLKRKREKIFQLGGQGHLWNQEVKKKKKHFTG